MRRSDIPLAVLDGRHTGELLAHPCPCQPGCTLGEHIWDSTRNMTPGPRATNYEPRVAGTGAHSPPDGPERPDPTRTAHDDYQRLLAAYTAASRDLRRFIDAHRPDRTIPLPDPGSDDEWCRNHLTGIGLCEPRYRGDLCRWCWEVGRAHGTVPDVQFMRERRDRGRSTPVMEAAFLTRLKASRPSKKRKKAS